MGNMVIKCSKNYWTAMQDSKIRIMQCNIMKLRGLVYSYFISIGQRGTQKSAPNTSSHGFPEASSSLPLWCPPAKHCVPTHRPMLHYIYIMPPSYIHPNLHLLFSSMSSDVSAHWVQKHSLSFIILTDCFTKCLPTGLQDALPNPET